MGLMWLDSVSWLAVHDKSRATFALQFSQFTFNKLSDAMKSHRDNVTQTS